MSSLPPGWVEHTAKGNNTYWFHKERNFSTYTHPEQWEKCNKDCWPEYESGIHQGTGKQWWRHRETKEVVWIDPNTVKQAKSSNKMIRDCPYGLGLKVYAPECDLKCLNSPKLRPCGCIFYKEDPLPLLLRKMESGVLSAKYLDSDSDCKNLFYDAEYNFNAHDYNFAGCTAPVQPGNKEIEGKYIWRRPFNSFNPKPRPGYNPDYAEFLIGKSGIGEGDIRQGSLGDCWLLGSIAAVAGKFPGAIKNCLNYSEKHGAMSFKFRSPDDGKPRYILMDDQIVCGKSCHDHFMFCKSVEKGELWPVFMEKAFSKWCGGYMNVRGGVQNVIVQSCEPMQALSFAKKDYRITGNIKESSWDEILEMEDAGWLIKVSAKGTGQNLRDPITGLVGSHQFTVLDLIETTLDSGKDFCEGHCGFLEELSRNPDEFLNKQLLTKSNVAGGNSIVSGGVPKSERFVHIYNESGESSISVKFAWWGVSLTDKHKYYAFPFNHNDAALKVPVEGKFEWVGQGKPVDCNIGDAVYLKPSGKVQIVGRMEKVKAEMRDRAARVRTSPAYAYWQKNGKNAKLRLVKLRNPWGHGEWKGLWSDESPVWTYFPEVAKKVDFKAADDGTFFMQWTDFIKFFENLIACGDTDRASVMCGDAWIDGGGGVVTEEATHEQQKNQEEENDVGRKTAVEHSIGEENNEEKTATTNLGATQRVKKTTEKTQASAWTVALFWGLVKK